MGRGDVLAAGGRSATFFPAKPQIKNVAPFVTSADLDAVADPKSDSHIPTLVDNSALFKKPRALFKGQPRNDFVLVTRVEKENSSLLVIPDVAKGKSDIGKVEAVGWKVSDLHPGMMVLFDRYASVGMEVTLETESGEKEHLMLASADIMLVLEPIEEKPESVS